MELGRTRKIYLRRLRRTILQNSALVTNKEKPLQMFLYKSKISQRDISKRSDIKDGDKRYQVVCR